MRLLSGVSAENTSAMHLLHEYHALYELER